MAYLTRSIHVNLHREREGSEGRRIRRVGVKSFLLHLVICQDITPLWGVFLPRSLLNTQRYLKSKEIGDFILSCLLRESDEKFLVNSVMKGFPFIWLNVILSLFA